MDKNKDNLSDMQSDSIIGYMNGMIFAFCWGTVYGPFQNFQNQNQSTLKSLLRYQRTSLIKLPPMSALIRVTNGYLESQGYHQYFSATVSLLLCFGYLTIVKFPK